MSKMLERVARAIYDSTYKSLPKSERDEDWEVMKPAFIDDARAAVKALKEPTDNMKDAGHLYASIGSVDAGDAYSRMIDCILKDED